jgi:hypothetical protein
MSISRVDAARLVNFLDVDRSGTVDFREFLTRLDEVPQPITGPNAKKGILRSDFMLGTGGGGIAHNRTAE